jgi:hemerythrin-like metal-binding protein
MTAGLQWTDIFSLGHPELDAEHRQMVDLINRICLAHDAHHRVPEPIALLHQLEHLTMRHFEHEESVLEALYSATPNDHPTMRETLAAAQMEHAAEHWQRLNDLRNMTSTVANDPLNASKPSNLCEQLKAWFIDHAIGYEAQIKTIIQSI